MAKRSLTFMGSPEPSAQKVSRQQSIPLSPTSIDSPSNNATVHALIASLSPVRPSRYFDGELTDGDSVIRIVGFDKAQRQQLNDFCEQQLPITLKNCQIQYNKAKNKLEVVLRTYTKIERSHIKFDVPDMKTVGSPLIPLCDLEKKEEYDKVTVRIKVIKLHDPQTVGTGKIKQDVTIADATAKATLTLWESNVKKLDNQKSYQLNRVIVRIFMGKHHLSIPPSGSSIDEISDVEDLSIDTDSSEEEEESVVAATIVGVQQLERNFHCMNCKKIVDPSNDTVGICSSCNTTQLLCNSKLSSKLFVKALDNDTPIALKAYSGTLQAITGKNPDKVTSEDLLFAPQFNLTYNKFHVITCISRN